jgi:hypothetical protein
MIRKQTIFPVSLMMAFIFLSAFNVLCQDTAGNDSDACRCSKEIAALSRRIDSLEARLEGQQIQIVESNPFKSGSYLKWGKGWTLAATKSEQRMTLDIGYTFLTPKSFRIGMFLGHDAQMGADCELPYAAFYGKTTIGTPVFINFISVNGYFRALYYPKFAQKYCFQTAGGLSAGAELEFWLRPTLCYTFGGSITTMRERTRIRFINLSEINFIGFKYYPQCKKKKR